MTARPDRLKRGRNRRRNQRVVKTADENGGTSNVPRLGTHRIGAVGNTASFCRYFVRSRSRLARIERVPLPASDRRADWRSTVVTCAVVWAASEW